jgi:dolichyl-phosphate-mannose--protein O-mannosyl transferase
MEAGLARSAVVPPSVPRASRAWTKLDTLAVGSVAVLSAGIRSVGLTSLPSVFDEGYYAVDSCIAALGPGPPCHEGGLEIVAPVHPPLGTLIIGLGIRLFGYRPGGWRVAALGAGVLTVIVLYVLARKLFHSTLAATLASGFLALDFLHFIHSRIAMLDVFLTLFGTTTFLFLVVDRDAKGRAHRWLRPWRLAAGAVAGAAAATKWPGLAFVAGAVLVTLTYERSRRTGRSNPWRLLLAEEGPSIAVGLLAMPVAVYVLSHVGRVDGAILAWPWSTDAWVRSFLAEQSAMLRFHAGLDAPHFYGSPAWSWPLLKRPIVYLYEASSGGRFREVLAIGSPLAWWASFAALGWLCVDWFRRRGERHGGGLVLAGFAFAWLPWLAVSPLRGTTTFLFYLLPAVPFMCLGLGWAGRRIARQLGGRVMVVVFCLGALGAFAFYHPLLTGAPIELRAWEQRILFTDCDLEGLRLSDISLPEHIERPVDIPGPYPEALLRLGSPPAGWCWV